MISTSGHLISNFPEVRFHRTRIFSMMMCVILVVGCLPVNAFAEDLPQDETVISVAADDVNLALGKQVTVSGNEPGTPDSAVPEGAVDGNTGTRWSAYPAMKNVGTVTPTQTPDVEWIVVDLGEASTFHKVILKAYSNKAWPTKYALQVSDDGTTFTTVKECVWTESNDTGVVQENILDTPAKGRFVKILVHEMNRFAAGAASISIAELEILGAAQETEPETEVKNLLEGLPAEAATASSCEAGTIPGNAINGNIMKPLWGSADMKSGTIADDAAQTPQWLQVDMGSNIKDVPLSSIELWYVTKTWPMVYEVQTSPDGEIWETLVRVERPSAADFLTNGPEQNIGQAESGAYVDRITADTVPAVKADAKIQRYVRVYAEKVNAQAPGNGVGITEFRVFGKVPKEEEGPKTIVSVAQPEGIRAGIGTRFEDLNLPTAVIATLDDKTTIDCPVTWSADGYQADKAGVCTLQGTLVPAGESIQVGEGVTVSIRVEVYDPEAKEPWNLALGRKTNASASETVGPEVVTDGNTGKPHWGSGDMKDWYHSGDTSKDEIEQIPQWVTIDLKAAASTVSQIKLWYDGKVWPMEYEIQTSDTEDFAEYDVVASVKRHSFNGFATNSEGQNIAKTNENSDTLTLTSSPSLESTSLKRYVRLYAKKTNAQAGGVNINVNEIQIFGTNDLFRIEEAMEQITHLENPTAEDTKLTLPETREEADLVFRGSEIEHVVANDGTISKWNIGPRDVTMMLRMTEKADLENYMDKNLTVTIPDHSYNYPKQWFPEVKNPNARPVVIPSLQEWYGYEGNFVLKSDSRIILNDAASVDLKKIAEKMITDIEEICDIKLTYKTGTEAEVRPQDIYIESLTDKNAYDLGDEGYLMVTNANGLHVYAPTYVGCLYGTISAEQILWLADDHASIPMGITRDYPNYEVRGYTLDLGRTPYRIQQVMDYAKVGSWYKMNEYHLHINDDGKDYVDENGYTLMEGFHRLESESFPSLKSENRFTADPDSQNTSYDTQIQGNAHYTKEEYRELQKLCLDLGITPLTELDTPSHSSGYTNYAYRNPDKIGWLEGGIHSKDKPNHHIDLVGDNKERAKRFITTLWDEYTGGIEGMEPAILPEVDIVHVGSDEYWGEGEATKQFRKHILDIYDVVHKNGKKRVRMWGSFGSMNVIPEPEDTEKIEIDSWFAGYDNPALRSAQGFKIVSCQDSAVYGNPGRDFRDVMNAEFIFEAWDPTMFGTGTGSRLLFKGDPNLIGTKMVVWGEESHKGYIEKDVNQRVLRNIIAIGEKAWGGTRSEDKFEDFEIAFRKMQEGPGTQIAMKIDSETPLVLDYDFNNISADGKTVFDASGNGYDAVLTGKAVTDNGYLTFDGTTLLKTNLKTLSYPYTVSFDVKLSAEEAKANLASTAADDTNRKDDAALFSGYDGRLLAMDATHNGNLTSEVNYFARDYGYQLPQDGTSVNVTLVGTFQSTRLYVNGKLVKFYSRSAAGEGMMGSFVLPLEKIGENFHGQLANVKVYNKAMIPSVIDGEDQMGYVEVAQNHPASGNTFDNVPGSVADAADRRLDIAEKAFDGDAFDIRTETEGSGQSQYGSLWKGYQSDAYLFVDLETAREVSRVIIQWTAGGIGKDFEILTSMDGKTWTSVKDVTGNTGAVTTIDLETPVEARYVKVQGKASNNGNTYMIQELQVFEKVDKSELSDLLEQMKKLVDEKKLGFENDPDGIFEDYTFGQSVLNDPLTTQKDVQEAIDRLNSVSHVHTWKTPVWTWSGFEASVKFVCEADESHVATPDVTVTGKVTTPATCTKEGEKTYTASVVFEGKTYTDTKVEVLPKTPHHLEDGICIDCGEDFNNHGSNGGNTGHKHTGNGAWVSDMKDHWKVCECGTIIEKEPHVPDENGECRVCHKVLEIANAGNSNTQSPNTGDTMNALPLVVLLGAVLVVAAEVLKRKNLIK